MEQGHRILRRKSSLSDEQKQQYKDLLKHAYTDPWWRQYINLVEREINNRIVTLVEGGLAKEDEDKNRGWLQCLGWILAQDNFGANLNDPKWQEQQKKVEEHRTPQIKFED